MFSSNLKLITKLYCKKKYKKILPQNISIDVIVSGKADNFTLDGFQKGIPHLSVIYKIIELN